MGAPPVPHTAPPPAAVASASVTPTKTLPALLRIAEASTNGGALEIRLGHASFSAPLSALEPAAHLPQVPVVLLQPSPRLMLPGPGSAAPVVPIAPSLLPAALLPRVLASLDPGGLAAARATAVALTALLPPIPASLYTAAAAAAHTDPASAKAAPSGPESSGPNLSSPRSLLAAHPLRLNFLHEGSFVSAVHAAFYPELSCTALPGAAAPQIAGTAPEKLAESYNCVKPSLQQQKALLVYLHESGSADCERFVRDFLAPACAPLDAALPPNAPFSSCFRRFALDAGVVFWAGDVKPPRPPALSQSKTPPQSPPKTATTLSAQPKATSVDSSSSLATSSQPLQKAKSLPFRGVCSPPRAAHSSATTTMRVASVKAAPAAAPAAPAPVAVSAAAVARALGVTTFPCLALFVDEGDSAGNASTAAWRVERVTAAAEEVARARSGSHVINKGMQQAPEEEEDGSVAEEGRPRGATGINGALDAAAASEHDKCGSWGAAGRLHVNQLLPPAPRLHLLGCYHGPALFRAHTLPPATGPGALTAAGMRVHIATSDAAAGREPWAGRTARPSPAVTPASSAPASATTSRAPSPAPGPGTAKGDNAQAAPIVVMAALTDALAAALLGHRFALETKAEDAAAAVRGRALRLEQNKEYGEAEQRDRAILEAADRRERAESDAAAAAAAVREVLGVSRATNSNDSFAESALAAAAAATALEDNEENGAYTQDLLSEKCSLNRGCDDDNDSKTDESVNLSNIKLEMPFVSGSPSARSPALLSHTQAGGHVRTRSQSQLSPALQAGAGGAAPGPGPSSRAHHGRNASGSTPLALVPAAQQPGTPVAVIEAVLARSAGAASVDPTRLLERLQSRAHASRTRALASSACARAWTYSRATLAPALRTALAERADCAANSTGSVRVCVVTGDGTRLERAFMPDAPAAALVWWMLLLALAPEVGTSNSLAVELANPAFMAAAKAAANTLSTAAADKVAACALALGLNGAAGALEAEEEACVPLWAPWTALYGAENSDISNSCDVTQRLSRAANAEQDSEAALAAVAGAAGGVEGRSTAAASALRSLGLLPGANDADVTARASVAVAAALLPLRVFSLAPRAGPGGGLKRTVRASWECLPGALGDAGGGALLWPVRNLGTRVLLMLHVDDDDHTDIKTMK